MLTVTTVRSLVWSSPFASWTFMVSLSRVSLPIFLSWMVSVIISIVIIRVVATITTSTSLSIATVTASFIRAVRAMVGRFSPITFVLTVSTVRPFSFSVGVRLFGFNQIFVFRTQISVAGTFGIFGILSICNAVNTHSSLKVLFDQWALTTNIGGWTRLILFVRISRVLMFSNLVNLGRIQAVGTHF